MGCVLIRIQELTPRGAYFVGHFYQVNQNVEKSDLKAQI